MLIVGLLFVVALLAVGGAVWLTMSDRQGSGKALAPNAAAPGQPAPAAPQRVGRNESEVAPATVPGASDRLIAPVPVAPAAHEERSFPALNGQFYELAAELRALHSEAQDIERRLGVLTEMVSRIEREYGEVGLGAE
jgi:hypothetical protein